MEIYSIVAKTAIQATILLLTLSIFLIIYNLRTKNPTNLRTKNRASLQSNPHFLRASHLLTRSKSTRNQSTSSSLAKDALAEADKALAIKPRDAAANILRGVALDILGRRTAAIRALDAALTVPMARSLSDRERGDALVKRAEVLMKGKLRRRVDSVVSDLVEAVELTRGDCDDGCKVFCLLGRCYEFKGSKVEAFQAFQNAFQLDPLCRLAQQGLDRLKESV